MLSKRECLQPLSGKNYSIIEPQPPPIPPPNQRFGDFLHLIIYQLHLQEPDKRFSWAYATVVQKLWLRKEVVLSPSEKKSLVGETISAASQKFKLPTSEIAFSDSSIVGVLNWLRSLSPPVIESEGKSENFSRRYFCVAPLMVKAELILQVETVYRKYGLQTQQEQAAEIARKYKVPENKALKIIQEFNTDTTNTDTVLNFWQKNKIDSYLNL